MKSKEGSLDFYRGSSELLRYYGEYLIGKMTLEELINKIYIEPLIEVLTKIEFDERFNFSAIEFLMCLYEKKNNFRHLPMNTLIFLIKYREADLIYCLREYYEYN